MHILTEITCKWTDAVSVSCMFITCNYIPEKNTAYLCMSSPHTTSPQQIVNSRTRVTGKPRDETRRVTSETTQTRWLAWTKLCRARQRDDFQPSWAGGHEWRTPFISCLDHGRTREHLVRKKQDKKDFNTELGCDFTIPLACMRVVLFTALSIRAPSIQMNVMHLPENGQNGSGLFLHECTRCQCTTERQRKRKVAVTLFRLPLQSD